MGRSRQRTLLGMFEEVRCKRLLAVALAITSLSLTACGAKYHYNKVSPDGSTCELTIYSAREVKAADLLLDSDCAIMGGAAGLKNSAGAYKVIEALVQKIP